MNWVLLVGGIVMVAVYIFGSAGFSLATVFAFLGWVVAGMGFLAFIGGERRNGLIAIVVGIMLANITGLL